MVILAVIGLRPLALKYSLYFMAYASVKNNSLEVALISLLIKAIEPFFVSKLLNIQSEKKILEVDSKKKVIMPPRVIEEGLPVGSVS